MSPPHLLVLVGLLVLATQPCLAHICVWQPMQRGEFDISTPGADPCYRKVGPCGSETPGPSVTPLRGGQLYAVQFQQNLNHYYVGNPGYLDVSWAKGPNPTEQDFQALAQAVSDYNAMNEITQTNFSFVVTIPSVQCDACVLRVRYVSNNPLENDRGEIFYQCSDITITSSDRPSSTSQPPAMLVPLPPILTAAGAMSQGAAMHPVHVHNTAVQTGTPCCTPKQWQAGFSRAFVTGSGPYVGTIYYDALNQLMRVDLQTGDNHGNSTFDGTFQMFMNFTSGAEYYYNVNANTCGAYGLDYWNDWCYGTTNQSESYFSSFTIAGAACDLWNNGDFFFGNTQVGCLPVSLSRTTGDITVYYNVTLGISDPSVFSAIPSVCLHHQLQQPQPHRVRLSSQTNSMIDRLRETMRDLLRLSP